MANWWDTANDENEPTLNRVAAGVGCGLLPWVCVAQSAADAASEATDDARESLESMASEASGGGGLFSGFGDALSGASDSAGDLALSVGEGASRPLLAVSDIIKWASVFVGIMLLAGVLALVVWYGVLPFLDGGPRG